VESNLLVAGFGMAAIYGKHMFFTL